MLSGIGPAAHLRRARHRRRRRPARRRRRTCRTIWSSTSSRNRPQPITLYSVLNPFSKALIGAQWLFFKTGLGATNHFEAAAFVRSARRRRLSRHPVPLHPGRGALRRQGGGQVARLPGACRADALEVARHGHAALAPIPWAKPEIRFNYMSHPDDWARLPPLHPADARDLRARRRSIPIAARRSRRAPTCRATTSSTTSSAQHAESAYHPCGTCRMGARRRPDERRRSGMPGHRRRGPARRRLLDLPARHQRQSQRARRS